MIDLLVFQESGLMLLKKEYCHSYDSRLEELEDLVTGFFSAVFQFFAGKFGEVKSIRTEKKLFLIRKVQGVYISLLISLFDMGEIQADIDDDSIWIMNKRLEETSLSLLTEIERKIATHIFKLKCKDILNKPHTQMFVKIEKSIDKVVEEAIYKISIIKRLIARSNISKKETLIQEI